jgi:hypothetical protein
MILNIEQDLKDRKLENGLWLLIGTQNSFDRWRVGARNRTWAREKNLKGSGLFIGACHSWGGKRVNIIVRSFYLY